MDGTFARKVGTAGGRSLIREVDLTRASHPRRFNAACSAIFLDRPTSLPRAVRQLAPNKQLTVYT
jgi:hypothetical protein